MKLIIAALITCFAMSFAIVGQTASGFTTVATEDGMIVINNNMAQRFSFFVAGKNPQRGEFEGDSFLVSTDTDALSESLLVFFIKKSEFLDAKKTYLDAEVLIAHRDKGIAGHEKAYGSKPVVDEKTSGFVKVLDPANKLFPTKLIPTICWSYIAPPATNTDRTIFQTVAIGDGVLMLGTVFNRSIKPETVRVFLKQTLESIALLPAQKVAPKPKPAKRTFKKK